MSHTCSACGVPLGPSESIHVAGEGPRCYSCFNREIADRLGIEEAGLTVHDYLAHVRVRRAWDLIRQGEKIEAVALLVGYRSKKNFYRQFKAISGVTPGEFLHAPHGSTGTRGRTKTEE